MNPDFKRTRKIRAFHRRLQILLALTLVLAINFLASRNYERVDLTDARTYSLSPESKGYLRNLEGDIRIFVTIPDSAKEPELDRLREDIRGLLREIRYVIEREAADATLEVEFVDLYKERSRARELKATYGLDRPNSIIVAAGDTAREISPDQLYTFNEGQISGFRGESAFLSAILDVVYRDEGKLYLIVGQGEMRYDDVQPDRGLSQAYDFIRESGVLVDELDLTQVDAIPEDARAILIPSPSAAYRSREVEMLRDFLGSGGSVLAFVDPGVETGLGPLFAEWGIQIPDMVVIDTGNDYQATSGSLILRRFSKHPLTEILIDLQVTLLTGLPRPVLPDPTEGVRSRGIELESILATSENSFGESSYRNGSQIRLDPDVDLMGPVSIAVAAERSLSSQAGVPLASDEAGRILVVGNADLISNAYFLAAGNPVFFRNAIHWAVERQELLDLPPRAVTEYLLVLSKEKLYRIAGFFLLIPAAFLATAGLTHLARR